MALLDRLLPHAALSPRRDELLRTIERGDEAGDVLRFDAVDPIPCAWIWTAPQGIDVATLDALVFFTMASGTDGSISVNVRLQAVTPGDALNLHEAVSYGADNIAGASVPAVNGRLGSLAVPLVNDDNLAAGDLSRLRFERDAPDTACGDVFVHAIELRDGN